MNLNPFELFDPSYLFDARPGSSFFYFWPLLILFFGLFIGSFWMKQKNLAARMREFSALGVLLSFFRDQNIPYLGMRLLMVLLFLIAIVYTIAYWRKQEYLKMLKPAIMNKSQKIDQYLPKPKKKHR